ncbi:hypothetical protein E0504_10745 [Parafrankia sp. BMG5.11]|nr:hypothetical protein E0504_10745 [Parafrankia sp. BMG5.11]
MSAVVSALRRCGDRAALISLPVPKRRSNYQAAFVSRQDGFPACFLASHGNPFVRKLITCVSLFFFVWRAVRPGDRVLLYNHAIEYAPALLLLRALRVPVYHDIEDVPTMHERGLRGAINKASFEFVYRLTSVRKVTASNQIARELRLKNFKAVQGIFTTEALRSSRLDKWQQLQRGGALRVHFGGTLSPATGTDVFCDAILQLSMSVKNSSLREIVFVVTGVGDLDRIKHLSEYVRSPRVRIEVYPAVSRAQYLDLLDSCHGSLSLKSPSSEISRTTFPSKVVEITSRGLSLVATRISDVVHIFDENMVWFLTHFSGEALCEILEEMSENPDEVRRRADLGRARSEANFSSNAVGTELSKFLRSDSADK